MNTVNTNVITSFLLKIAARSDISGILAPDPPIISAITAPIPIPLESRTLLIGSIVSVRIYMGMPIRAATGMAIGLLGPAIFTIKSSGIKP